MSAFSVTPRLRQPAQHLLLGFAACGLLSVPVQAASLSLNSQTTSVTAYQGQALVTRQVQLPALSVGTHEIQIGDLPQGLNAQSLTVTGRGQARIRIHHVQLSPPESHQDDPALSALRTQVENLQQQLNRVSNQQELNQTHQALLQTFQQQLQTRSREPRGGVSVREWEELTRFALSQQASMLENRRSTEAHKAELQEALQKLMAQLRESEQARLPRQRASLFISAETPGAAVLELSYLIGNVSWQPSYEARYDSTAQKLRLTYQGDLTQRSGEDWQNVQLLLSTATPLLNQRPPSPQRWYVGPAQPAASARMDDRRAMPQQMRNMAPETELGGSLVQEEVHFSQSSIEQTGVSVRFQLPETQSVPSSTQSRRLAMAQRELTGESAYKIIPRQSPLAFLEVAVTNNTGLPLLPGNLRTYVGPEFTGSGPLELIRPGQPVRLNFGVDQDIKVQWKERNRETQTTGLLGDTQQLTISYLAEITNFKQQAVKLRVLEPAPTTGSDTIRVELLSSTPAISSTSDEGLHTWLLTAQPWEKKTVELVYRVSYPKGVTLQL
ncbi:MAG: mucoidy inhibitor MuiA family protein [Candidatus Sericytochromatia bacterium]